MASDRVGKFRLIAELGTGGMAEVYLAIDESLGAAFKKLIVVKRVRSNLAEDAEYAALLLDEARISARLNHANVVQIIEVGVEENRPFLAMEYLEGQSLARIEKRALASGGLPPEAVYSVMCDVLRGLQHAHDLADFDGRPLGIVHRDVSPHNVFVTYDGHVKLLDFGIAKAAGRMVETELGIARGKVRYMAPEQARCEDVDRRTDLFSVGIMIWQAACGQRFWDRAMGNPHVMEKLSLGQFDPSPRAVCPDVPEAIDAICRRALAFDRAERYASANEMLGDLETYLGAADVEARRTLASSVRTLFEEDRAERRALLEQLATSSALSHVVETAAKLAATRSGGHLPIIVEAAPESEHGSGGATSISLANVLEPTAGLVQAPRKRRLGIWLAVGGALTATAAVAAIAIVGSASVLSRTHGGSIAAAARERNAIPEDRSDLALASDGVDLRAEIRPGSSAVHGSKKPKPPAASRPAKPRASSRPVAGSASSSTAKSPTLDHTDPWR